MAKQLNVHLAAVDLLNSPSPVVSCNTTVHSQRNKSDLVSCQTIMSVFLSRLYRDVASELSFNEFHLYLRPVQFEVTEQKVQTEQRPIFITAVLEDEASVDR